MTNFFEKIKVTDNFILFIYMYIFLMPWNFFKWQMGVLTVVIFIWWIIKYKSQLKEKIKTIFEFKPLFILILFIVYSYITILWSSSWTEGFQYVNDFHKYYFLLIPVLFTSLNSKEAKNGVKIFIISFTCYSVFSILIYLGLFTIEDTGSTSSNPKGIMGYAIVTQYMAIGSIASFFLAIFSKSKNRSILFFISSVLCFFALFVNNSRTAQLAFLLSVIVLFIIYYKKAIFKIKNFIFFLMSVILITFITLFLLDKSNKLERFKTAYNELEEVITENEYEGSFGLRIYFTKTGIEIFKKNVLFGTGPQDNVEKLEEIMENDPNYTNNRTFTSFHSTHIDFLTRYGLIGYLLLVGSIVYLFYMYKYKDKYFYIGISFYTVIFFISFANATFSKKPINYILITFFVLLSIIAYNQIKENKLNVKLNK